MASEADKLEQWFSMVDTNHDGRIEGIDAAKFFQRSGLPRETLKEVWDKMAGSQPFMTKQQFFGAVRLVSLAQISGGRFLPAEAQKMLSGLVPPPPLPKLAGLTPETWNPEEATTWRPPPILTGPPMQHTGGSLTREPAFQVTGQVPYTYTGGRPEPNYPPLPYEEYSRYVQLFHSLDLDQDGFVQGRQCIDVFSSRGVDRAVLKQIWQVVVGNAAQINKEQFIQCLYLIEIAKQGMPVPVALPRGGFPPVAQGTSTLTSVQGYGQGGIPTIPSKAQFQPPDPSAYPGWKGPASNEGMISTLDPSQRDRIMAERLEAQKKDQHLFMMNQEAETARAKREFFEKSLQELKLFKSRMDVALMEIQEKHRRETELAADAEKRYEQIRYGAEEAARDMGSFNAKVQEMQQRKTELEAKVNELQQDLAVRERSHPELVHQHELQIQVLQESVASLEQRRNTLTAELETYRHQHDLLNRRQGDLQMAIAAAEAEVHSASGDIEKIAAQVEAVKKSNDIDQIQKLLREASRVYSNLHSHALKAGVEIPLEARLALYGDNISWTDDLIGTGIDVSSWQEDGFVMVDAFPDIQTDMDIEFEKAIQNAVNKYEVPLTTETIGPESRQFSGDPFQGINATHAQTQSSDFVAFDAFQPETQPSKEVVAPSSLAPPFEMRFDAPAEAPVEEKSTFAAFETSFGAETKTENKPDNPDPSFDFFSGGTEPKTTTAPSDKLNTLDFDPFGDSAF